MSAEPVREVKFLDVKLRRDRLRELGWCICGPMGPPGTPSRTTRLAHGPVVRAGKCARCLIVHKETR